MRIKEYQVTITRAEMKDLKRMDHKQLEGVLSRLYALGAEDTHKAWKESNEQITDAVMETVSEIKGIGPKRRQEFIQMFQRKVEQKRGENHDSN